MVLLGGSLALQILSAAVDAIMLDKVKQLWLIAKDSFAVADG